MVVDKQQKMAVQNSTIIGAARILHKALRPPGHKRNKINRGESEMYFYSALCVDTSVAI